MQDTGDSDQFAADDNPSSRRSSGYSGWWHLLLLIPLIGLLYPPLYAHMYPTLGGLSIYIGLSALIANLIVVFLGGALVRILGVQQPYTLFTGMVIDQNNILC